MQILETARLRLRELTVDDAPFMLGLLNEPSFLMYIGDRGVRTAEAARDYLLAGPIESYKRFGFGLYLAELQTGDTPIGICGLVKRDFLPDADLGFAFTPPFWGQGYAYEAASAVMRHGREVIRLKRIVAIVSPGNGRSIRLLEKLGLRFEAMLRLPGESQDVQLFAADRPPTTSERGD